MKIPGNIEPLLNISMSELKRALRKYKLFYLKKKYGGTDGYCNICGSATQFILWENTSLSNSMACEHCCGIARYRLLALIIANYFAQKESSPVKNLEFCKNLNKRASLKGLKKAPGINVLDTSFKSFIYKELDNKYNLMMSEYIPSILPKKKLFGIWHQDLTNINAPDNYFDCIITSEVFEHVYDPDKAFREIKRVLKPNGVHVFTLPFHEAEKTVIRASIENGEVINHLEPAYHIDPLSKTGALVFTDFGQDLIARLNGQGLMTEYISLTDTELGFNNTYALVSLKV